MRLDLLQEDIIGVEAVQLGQNSLQGMVEAVKALHVKTEKQLEIWRKIGTPAL